MTFSAGVAAGYYSLKPGTQFIQIDGKALPIKGLAGTVERGFFCPSGSANRYLIKTRQETQREAYEANRSESSRPALQAVSLPRPVVSSFDPGPADIFSDWK